MTVTCPHPAREPRSGAGIAAVMLAAVAAAALLASQGAAEPAPADEVLRHVSPALGR